MPPETSFQAVLAALKSDKPFTPRLLAQFSDLGPGDIKDFLAAWPSVPAKRKHRLLTELADLAGEDTLVSFDELGIALLPDADTRVRVLALRLLGECEDARLAPRYMEMLSSDPDAEARAAAAAALNMFVLLGEYEELAPEAHRKVEESLLAAATGGDRPEVRRAALESLGSSSRPEVPALIEAAAAREDPDWVASALVAIGRSGDERWIEAVLSRLTDEESAVRLAAARAAGELGLPVFRQPLFDLLEEEDDDGIFAAAVWSLSQIGGPDTRAFLETLLDHVEESEEEDLIEFVEDALDNLTFTEEMEGFDLLIVDPDVDPDKKPGKA